MREKKQREKKGEFFFLNLKWKRTRRNMMKFITVKNNFSDVLRDQIFMEHGEVEIMSLVSVHVKSVKVIWAGQTSNDNEV
jgi:hypothetical protein